MHFFTISGALALLNIIIIDIVMSGDNAIVIGMATKDLDPHYRKKAIFWGIFGATLLRVGFALIAIYLLSVPGLQFIGGLLLAYVVYKFALDLIIKNKQNNDIKKGSSGFKQAIITIILADVSMSLDNVLAVAGASNGHMLTLIIGLAISILLMAFASNYIAKKLHQYPFISWIGLIIIAYVTIEMLIKGWDSFAGIFI
ncbi:TerC family protein [Candidatus Gracilibacteria bacterium]|nr:TerC family protein [Candidatus Gracilibacteria bacterium]